MDPNSSYCFKIRLLGNPKKARKDIDSFCFEKVIDSKPNEGTNVPVKVRAKKKKRELVEKIPMVPFDSPTMGTRSKKVNPANPAMSTRSKRRLSL